MRILKVPGAASHLALHPVRVPFTRLAQLMKDTIRAIVSADPSKAKSVSRVVDVWTTRRLFTASFLDKARSALGATHSPQAHAGPGTEQASTPAPPPQVPVGDLDTPLLQPAPPLPLPESLPPQAERPGGLAAPLTTLLADAKLRLQVGEAGEAAVASGALPPWLWLSSADCANPGPAVRGVGLRGEGVLRALRLWAAENECAEGALLEGVAAALAAAEASLAGLETRLGGLRHAQSTLEQHRAAEAGWEFVQTASAALGPAGAPSGAQGSSAAAGPGLLERVMHDVSSAALSKAQPKPVKVDLGPASAGKIDGVEGGGEGGDAAAPSSRGAHPAQPEGGAGSQDALAALGLDGVGEDEEGGGSDGEGSDAGGASPRGKVRRVGGGDVGGDAAPRMFDFSDSGVKYNTDNMVFNPVTQQMQHRSAMVTEDDWRD